ncbi:MAG: hypothetical protein R3F20_14915 [Planctomycetota bacterium]
MWLQVSYALATVAMVLIGAGLVFARQRRRHIPLMLAAFVADVVGLVIVEFVVPRVEGKSDPVSVFFSDFGVGMTTIHAFLATLSLIGYFIQIGTGRKLMTDPSAMAGHKKGAMFFLVTRLGAYITMWMV